MDSDPATGDAQNLAAAVETLTLAATSTADPFSSPIPFPSSPVAVAAVPTALPADSAALHDLAARGQWRALLDSTTRSLPLPHPSQIHLVHLTLHTLALFKLRRFSDAAAALPPLSDPRFQPPSSILPFALRLLHALLPQHLSDRPLSLDRLYSLLSFTRSRLPDPEWQRRESFLLSTLFCNHFANREFDVALSLVHSLLAAAPTDPVLLSRLAYIQLQIGDLHAATATFSMVNQLCPGNDIHLQNLVRRNRALVLLVAKDYVGAAREYEECIERDPADVVAINNKALCLLYSRDLSDSIKLLEGALERVPTAAVNETLVVNLCSMYELAYVNHGEIKKSLSNWIARVAPDDFDPSCTRI